jgi:saccharopine dehydrogenase (NADP+, L-glutamate forming)
MEICKDMPTETLFSKYIALYGLDGVKTMYRGTFRRPPYCAAWDVFVQLGCCDDSYEMESTKALSHADFIRAFIPATNEDLKSNFQRFLQTQGKDSLMHMFEWLEMFDEQQYFPFVGGSPAKHLQYILERKLVLKPGDKDLLVMLHKFHYDNDGKAMELISSLVVEGEDEVHTAMAKTVGLPIAIATKLILQGKNQQKRVVIPLFEDIYAPILYELASLGISFKEALKSL